MKSKKPDSKEPDAIAPALPSWRAFVIQLSRDATPDSGISARWVAMKRHAGERLADGQVLPALPKSDEQCVDQRS